MDSSESVRVAYWYFGGLAATAAASCTHPLDLIKVRMQTTTSLLPAPAVSKTITPASSIGGDSTKGLTVPVKRSPSMFGTFKHIVTKEGITALYAGLTACWLKQMTYSTARFAFYGLLQSHWDPKTENTLFARIVCSGAAGAIGGLIGAPSDLVNIRMQNDSKLPIEERRNYRNALHGLYKIVRNEGFLTLFNGSVMATTRAMLLTIGQLSMYDQFKDILLNQTNGFFVDDKLTYFTASLIAGAIATTLTHPLDVLKVRMMNAPGETSKGIFASVGHVVSDSGILGFVKGYVPAFIRLGPQTILTFLFFEQLRINFGYIEQSKSN